MVLGDMTYLAGSQLTVTVRSVTGTEFADSQDWRAVEAETTRAHYGVSHAWLTSWIRAYSPARLLMVRATAPDGTVVGIGLLESRRIGCWHFAGGFITPHARFLCTSGAEEDVWRAWSGWLGDNAARWTSLEAAGLVHDASSMPGAKLTQVPEFALPLPASFDAYLVERRPVVRKAFKQKLRRLARVGGEVRLVEAGRRHEVLERFVALHALRAEKKGEHHPHIDWRLAAMLASLPPDGGVDLRVLELVVDEEIVGVTVRLDHRETAYFYNAGFNPAHSTIGPGICLELASIEDAISRRMAVFDLGPGEWRYKRDLGGERRDAYRAVLTSSSPTRKAVRLAGRITSRVRPIIAA